MLTIEKMSGNEMPQKIRHTIRLGLRQYTIAFDIQVQEEEESEKYRWTEITFPPGRPAYAQMVSAFIGCRYPSDDMAAIINNHLMDGTGTEHEAEWNAMQAWRAECKRAAKEILGAI